MKYIGFQTTSLETVFADLKQTGNHLNNTPQEEFFSTLRDQTCENYIIHQVNNKEFNFYSALFNPAKDKNIAEASSGASHLLRFMPNLHGMIVDPANDTGFVVMDNFMSSKTASYLDMVVTKYEHLPTDTEGSQIRRIARGYNQGHLNRGFKVKSYSVVENEGKEIVGANLNNIKKNRVHSADHTLRKLLNIVYLDSHKDLILEALADFSKFVNELKQVLETDTTLKFVFSSLHIIFIIDYSNRTYNVKLNNFKKCMRVENTQVWSKEYSIDFDKLIKHIDSIAKDLENNEEIEEQEPVETQEEEVTEAKQDDEVTVTTQED